MDSKNSKVTFVTKIIFLRTFVIITSHCNVIRDNTKLEGLVTGIGQSSPGSFNKYFYKNILTLIFKAVQLKQEWKNQHHTENKNCPEFDFTSFKVPQIFFEAQIFFPWKFQIFECIFLKKDDFSDLTDNGVCLALVQSPICH